MICPEQSAVMTRATDDRPVMRGGFLYTNRHCSRGRREDQKSNEKHHSKGLTDHGDPPRVDSPPARAVPIASLSTLRTLG